MHLISIRLQNFACYEDTTITFPEGKITNVYGMDLDRNTSNGVGKSFLKEAILFALFGNAKVKLEDLVRKGAKGTVVTLNVEISGQIVEIKQGYRNKASSLEVRIGGKVIDFKTVREKRAYVANLIGMSYETCINFSIFDSIRFDDLSSLSSSEMKRLLQMLFNYEKFNAVLDKLKDGVTSNSTLLEQLRHRRTHFFSLTRKKVLEQFMGSSQKVISSSSALLSRAETILRKLSQQEGSSRTEIEKNSRFINWIIKRPTCPTCTKPLDNKTTLLNNYQVDINKNKKKLVSISNREAKIQKYKQSLERTITSYRWRRERVNGRIIKMEAARKEVKSVEEVEKQRDAYKMSLEVMKKFEAYVLEHYLKYLEQIINQYLEKLIDITCSISFLRQGSLMTRSIDKFCLNLLREGEEYSYAQLSSGERMIIAYAFKLAINTLNFKDTFLFIDEGLNKLDVHNRDKLVKMLHDSPFNQIFLISHLDAFEGLPKIYIEKQNDKSVAKIIGI